MKKIQLDLDQLKVESFEINQIKQTPGTVKGNAPVIHTLKSCDYIICDDSKDMLCTNLVNCPTDIRFC